MFTQISIIVDVNTFLNLSHQALGV